MLFVVTISHFLFQMMHTEQMQVRPAQRSQDRDQYQGPDLQARTGVGVPRSSSDQKPSIWTPKTLLSLSEGRLRSIDKLCASLTTEAGVQVDVCVEAMTTTNSMAYSPSGILGQLPKLILWGQMMVGTLFAITIVQVMRLRNRHWQIIAPELLQSGPTMPAPRCRGPALCPFRSHHGQRQLAAQHPHINRQLLLDFLHAGGSLQEVADFEMIPLSLLEYLTQSNA